MTILTGSLLIAGAILVLAAVIYWGVLGLEKSLPWDSYDERQKIARGKAYRVSFWVGMVWYMAIALWQVDAAPPVAGYLLVFAGMLLQVMAFHIYCLMTHSALPLSKKPVPTIICYFMVGAGYLLNVSMHDYSLGTPMAGRGSVVWLCLMLAVCFICLGIMQLISLLWKEKE